MLANVEVGRDLGHLNVAPHTIVEIEEMGSLPPERTVIVCTGSQGEPLSALSLIAAGEAFRAGELPGLADEASAVVLVRRLVREGVLEVVRDDG